MARKNLTKKQIFEATTFELICRARSLHVISAKRHQDESTPLTDIKECVAIDKELKARMRKALENQTDEASK